MKFFKWLKRYFSWLFLIFFGLFVYVLFFHSNSYNQLTELNRRISEMREEIKQTNDTAAYYRQMNRLLEASPEEMERIARERYHMQGPDEDVFIVE